MPLWFFKTWIEARLAGDRGANMVEYGLLVSLIALVAIGAIVYVREADWSNFSRVGSAFDQ